MSDYPQHDKLRAAHVSPQDGVLAEFIDFLNSKDIHFCKWPEPCELDYDSGYTEDDRCPCDDEGRDCLHCYDDHSRNGYHPGSGDGNIPYTVGGETEYGKWIAEFYGIDYKAFLDEKEALYRSISEAARQ